MPAIPEGFGKNDRKEIRISLVIFKSYVIRGEFIANHTYIQITGCY